MSVQEWCDVVDIAVEAYQTSVSRIFASNDPTQIGLAEHEIESHV
jgi:hypothetical protein